MKKLVTILLLLAMTLPVTACDNKQENTSQPENSVQQESSITTESNTAEIEQPQTVSPTKLTNKMMEMELDLVNRHALTLLDEIEKGVQYRHVELVYIHLRSGFNLQTFCIFH